MCRGSKVSYGVDDHPPPGGARLGCPPEDHRGAQQEGQQEGFQALKTDKPAPMTNNLPGPWVSSPISRPLVPGVRSPVPGIKASRGPPISAPPRLPPAFRAGMFGTQTGLNTGEGRQYGRKTAFSPRYRGHFTRYRWLLPGGPGVQSPTRFDPLFGQGAGRFSPQSR